jgi:RNA-directed DNA polymerase
MKKWNEKYHAKFKKYSLGNQVWDKSNLENAWKQVRANRGSAGVDGVTIEGFEQNLQQNLAEIERQLKENRYVPQPVKRVLIPKQVVPILLSSSHTLKNVEMIKSY